MIKVGFCAAYDWYFLKHSLPIVYELADTICIAIDKDRISWAGKPYTIDEVAFASFISEVDIDRKIKLYEDDFHRPELTPMENEVRQRNLMAAFMGDGGWHVQMDTDEYMIDFPGLVKYLKQLKVRRPVNVCTPTITLFKQIGNQYFLIGGKLAAADFFPVATNKPHYEVGRRNGYFNIKTGFVIVHQSWARSEEEITQKVENWGHKEDFDVAGYFRSWKGLNADNYQTYKDFHPLLPPNWPMLLKVEADSMPNLIEHFRAHPPMDIPKSFLRKENSIWRSRFLSILKKLG